MEMTVRQCNPVNNIKTHFSKISFSSVGIATVYGLDGQGSIPGKGKEFFSSPQSPDRLWGPPSLLHDGYYFPLSQWGQLHLFYLISHHVLGDPTGGFRKCFLAKNSIYISRFCYKMLKVQLIYTEGLTSHLTLKLVDFFGFVGWWVATLRNTHQRPEDGGVSSACFPPLPATL
jgi:hypothetical protein